LTRLLAVDTATGWGNVALLQSTAEPVGMIVVAEFGARMHGSQAAHLLPWVERLLDEAGWAKSSLDAFVATCGPGSFTGIRVGLGTCRGLALAGDRPCFGVGTLEAVAVAHGPADRVRVPFLEAGRGEIYLARYTGVEPSIERRAPWVAGLATALGEESRAGHLLIPGPDAPVVPGPRMAAAPRSIAAAAGRIAAARAASAPETLSPVPLYVRPPDALLGRARS
jgi:tRNA threonylcarbamoyladenosine biosynthesis protein TsaB